MANLAELASIYAEKREKAQAAGQRDRVQELDMNHYLDTCDQDPAQRPDRYDMGYGTHPLTQKQAPQPRPVSMENLAETMYSEFEGRFGYKPSEETAKLAARGFQGDLTTEQGRQAYYDRVAAYDGKTAREAPEQADVAGGRGGLASRVSDAGDRHGAVYGDGDNGSWMRELGTERYKAGMK